MSERPRHPKLEIETNVPAVVTIGKMFYKGKNEYGEYFGYHLTHDGSEYTFFASPFVHERFQVFGQGTTVRLIKRQRPGEKSVTWEIGEVNGHAPAQNGRSQERPKYEPSTFNREVYRQQRVTRMAEALYDANEVAAAIETQFEYKLSSEDLRAIAISFVIEENRDNIPLDPIQKPPDANIPALLEDIKKTLTDYIPGQSEIDQTSKAELLEHAFGVGKWQPITQMDGQALIEGLAKLKAKITEEQDGIPF